MFSSILMRTSFQFLYIRETSNRRIEENSTIQARNLNFNTCHTLSMIILKSDKLPLFVERLARLI